MDWTKAGALGTFGCLVLASVGLAIDITKPDVKPWVRPSLLIVAGCASGIVFVLASLRRFKKIRNLPIQILLANAEYIHAIYRRLHQDDRDHVRLPLHNSSLPPLKEGWNLIQVELYAQKDRLELLKNLSTHVWLEMGWPTAPVGLFRVDESTVMTDVLEALDDFRRILRTKVL